ncbi:uncharacterized protein [Primulina eburnea]|uniref:uncharacterized protein n=1 Tax=Primulina eburnea TaxID=1245227 RepID=UPI003C6C450B
MNFLIWNVRGLRSSESQQRLHAHVKEKRVKILAILEPMIDLDVRFMTRRFGFSRVISNSSGHIWVFFAEDVMVECLLDHTQFLHFRVSASFLPTTVYCSFVYAKCDYIGRRQLWTSLLQVKPDQGPWLVGGDFNVVRNSSECLGSSGGRLLPMEEFNHFILDSGLVDAGFEGSSFTWTNKTIWKRLDRVFVYVDWGDHFHSIRVEHLIRTVSDHCPLFVSVPVFASGPSSFRFQSMWLRHHGFLQTVRLNWNLPCQLNGMHRLSVGCFEALWLFRAVNINGSLTGFFGSTRGLRQGDPLSPLLFILGAEYLSRGLDRLYRQYPAIRYRSGCELPLSHLAYADDIIIFANGGTREMNSLMDFLHHYENFSGQLVNAFKSVIILPPRCSGRTHARLLRITGFGEGYFPIKYLGVPLFRGNRVCSLFDPLVQMVSKKLEGWELKTLSPRSRMTLLRSVLLSVPIYMFQVVQPPLAVMERLENVFNDFLWGSRPLDKKWHWARWSRACLPVSEGGLGFRRLKDIVESFSIKLWFRFCQGSSLWAKFMMRKYCQLVHPAFVSADGLISPTWHRLLKIRARAESGIRWRIGMGDVNFWDDIWCGDVPLSSQVLVRGARGVRVSYFLSDGVWDFDLLCSVVPPSVAETITLIPIASGEHDSAVWVHSSDGVFSLKSAWELVRLRDQVSDIFTPCWGSGLRPTMSFFLWRFWHQWLPVDDVLQRRGFELASKCQCCEMPETFTHIFIDCPLTRSVWHYFGAVFHVRIPLTTDFKLFLSAWKRHPGWTPRGHVKEFLPFIFLWFLWTARNDAKHRHLHYFC